MREPPQGRTGQALPRRTVIFIVRVWAEYLEETPPLWRGEIERADTGEVKPFETLEAMNDWIGLCLTQRGHPSEHEEARGAR